MADFAALKASIRIEDVLARYNLPLKKSNGTTLTGHCPLPSHGSEKSKQSFSVNTERNIWNCFSDSCKKARGKSGGDLIELVRQLENCTYKEAGEKLAGWFPPSSPPAPRTPPAESPARNIPLEEKHPGFTGLQGINPEHPEIQKRGISVETAQKFGIGYFPGKGSMAGRIVFPLFEHRKLIGYAGRTVLEVTDDNPKWRLPAGLVKSFLYNLERCDPHKPLVISESLWAPPFYDQQGIQVASLMGRELTEAQEETLAPFKIIWLALDYDAAGIEATKKIAERLKKSHAVRITYQKES